MECMLKFNEKEYSAKYNEQTDNYEFTIDAPSTGGLHDVEIILTNNFGITRVSHRKIQILEEENIKTENTDVVAYFLDKNTFEIKEVLQLSDYELIVDEETNAKSNFIIMNNTNLSADDFIIVREDNKIIYMGVIDAPLNENFGEKYAITSRYINDIFDRKIILKNQSLISEKGIEDFILYTIEHEFTKNADTILNKNFLDVEILTHTKKQFSVNNENGIYNFKTFLVNMKQNYNIMYDFKIVNGRLKLTIYRANENDKILIDTSIGDIPKNTYLENFSTNITAKVTVLCADKSEHSWYLLSDRTTTDNRNADNRAIGNIVTVYEEETENAREAAMNQFKANSYEHLIQFDINILSKIFDIKNWKVGDKVLIKNKNGEVVDTYISAISKKKDSRFYSIKTGNIRINFIEKFNQNGGKI